MGNSFVGHVSALEQNLTFSRHILLKPQENILYEYFFVQLLPGNPLCVIRHIYFFEFSLSFCRFIILYQRYVWQHFQDIFRNFCVPNNRVR